jgi:hypothetical protein
MLNQSNWNVDAFVGPNSDDTNHHRVNVRVMVFNAIFKNMSAISWRSVLFVDEW